MSNVASGEFKALLLLSEAFKTLQGTTQERINALSLEFFDKVMGLTYT